MTLPDLLPILIVGLLLAAIPLIVGYTIWRIFRDLRYKHKYLQILAKHRGYHGRWKVKLEHNSDTQLFSVYREDERAFVGVARTTYSRWDTPNKAEAFRIFERVKDMPQKEVKGACVDKKVPV